MDAFCSRMMRSRAWGRSASLPFDPLAAPFTEGTAPFPDPDEGKRLFLFQHAGVEDRCGGAFPEPDELADLPLVHESPLRPGQVGARPHHQHVALAEQHFGAHPVQDGSRVHVAGHPEGDAGGQVRLERAAHDVDRGALGRQHEVDALGAGPG